MLLNEIKVNLDVYSMFMKHGLFSGRTTLVVKAKRGVAPVIETIRSWRSRIILQVAMDIKWYLAGRGFGLIVFYKLRNQRGAKKQAPANGRMSCIKQPTHSLLPMVSAKMLVFRIPLAIAWLSENYFILLSPGFSLFLWCILSPNLFLLLLLFTSHFMLS